MVTDDLKQKAFLRKYSDINRKMEEEQAAQHARLANTPFLDLSLFPVDLNALAMLTKTEAEDAQTAIFYKEGSDLRLATVNPKNPLIPQIVKRYEEQRMIIKMYFVSRSSFEQLMDAYAKVAKPKEIEADNLQTQNGVDYAERLKQLAVPGANFSTTEMLEVLIGGANQYHASDIHIEPEEHILKIRFRLDGVLVDMAHLPKDVSTAAAFAYQNNFKTEIERQ